MNQRNFDDDRVDDSDKPMLPGKKADPDKEMLPCMWCSDPTPRGVLAQLGARCSRCFKAHCEAKTAEVDVGRKDASPKDWAHALAYREHNQTTGTPPSKRLTIAQTQAWRAALGLPEGCDMRLYADKFPGVIAGVQA